MVSTQNDDYCEYDWIKWDTNKLEVIPEYLQVNLEGGHHLYIKLSTNQLIPIEDLIDKHFGYGIYDAGNTSKFRFTIQKDMINELESHS